MPRPIEQVLKQARLNPADWISVQEAARRLGLSHRKIQSALACGPLYSKKIGSRRLVFVASVNRVLVQQQIQAAKPKNPVNAGPLSTLDSQLSTESDPERRISRIQSILDAAVPQHIITRKPQHPSSESPNYPFTQLPDLHHQPSTINHQLRIERRIWHDPARDDYWIPATRAAEILNIAVTGVSRLAEMGKIERRWADRTTNQPVDPATFRGRRRGMFSLRECEARAARIEKQRAGLVYSANDPERPLRRPIYRHGPPTPGDALISTKGAAAILGVGGQRISELVRDGRLFAWQKQPGKQGSQINLSANQVARYASKPDRLLRRDRDKLGKVPGHVKKPFKPNPFQEDNHIWDEPQKALKKEPRRILHDFPNHAGSRHFPLNPQRHAR